MYLTVTVTCTSKPASLSVAGDSLKKSVHLYIVTMARNLFSNFYYSFPVQLLINNIKRNHILILCWIVLFAMVTGAFGKYLGIPYLFLDPEYLNEVSFTSFFIIGTALGGFTIAFHITCYIIDGHRFTFVGTLPRPFTKFTLNNSLIPLAFLITYIYQIISFQYSLQYSTSEAITKNLIGFFSGYIAMTALLFFYFWWTNKDIFKYVVCQIDEKLKQRVQVTRATSMKKLDIARKRQVRVDNYLDFNFRFKKVNDDGFYDRATIIQVFDQNHLNLVSIELLIVVFVVVLGIFKDVPSLQLPAAASFIIFLTIFVMLAGAFSYWFGTWSTTAALVIFLIVNHLVGEDVFSKKYRAFGINYESAPVPYSVESLKALNDSLLIEQDRQAGLELLNNWRSKFPADEDPKMVFICVSGGGKRAALWALTALQTADSLTRGNLMKNSILITGASGGLIGASYFRELKLQELTGTVNPYATEHLENISNDNLNPLIFSLLANDLFVGFTTFEYNNFSYVRDRGYTFEEQLNRMTGYMIDKPLSAYAEPEKNGLIPILLLSPTIVNDGRKLYISSQPVSYMNSNILDLPDYVNWKISGVDFQKLFANHGADSMRFLSALRMCATFPYITPNTSLPSEPPIEIMDAGISDNFGVMDAGRFLYAFRDWISENTSGVIIVSIRDSPKLGRIPPKSGQTIVDNVTQPISNVYNNFENFQDIQSDMILGHATKWLRQPIHRVELEYRAESYTPILQEMDSLRQTNARASLSWRLTRREKLNIRNMIHSPENHNALEDLIRLIGQE